ncbi:hypothetical protein F4678DRAFT_165459 [Xylaria arbuscula]|nr:hypothetical protein F4678DRAFT_165459 [Xylaria arbuscula]
MPPAISSKACEPCRKKRRKCDLGQPGCSQCRRAGISCSGYRDAFALRMRDQSCSIARKVHAQRAHRALEASERSPSAVRQTVTTSSQTWADNGLDREDAEESEHNLDLLQIAHLPADVTELSLTYFMQTYAIQSFFAYLPDLYGAIPSEDRHNVDFIVSVPALVLLSLTRRDASLCRIAYARHAKALTKTQNALASPDLVARDSTLLSVLLLGLFEALVFQGRSDPCNWAAHMRGSATLLNIRGTSQFDTALGQRLFIHCSGQIAARYSTMCLPIPPFLKPLQDYAASIGAIDELGVRLGLVLNDFAALRIDQEAPPSTQRLQKFLELDRKISDFLEAMLMVAPYEKFEDTNSRPREIRSYRARCDKYPSHLTAKRYSNLRMMRLFISEEICDIVVPLIDALETGQNASCDGDFTIVSLDRIHEMAAQSAEAAINDMLFSVPYQIELSSDACNTVRSLILPLSSISVSTLSPLSARLYARERLAYISAEYGLIQARQYAGVSTEHKSLKDWILVSHWS